MAEENIVIKIKADIGITKEVIEAVTKAMEGLGKTATIVSGNVKITNKNLEDTNKILGEVAQTAKKTTGAIDGAGNSVKKSNQQWQALSLVVQDLPFGFRGIQNNLPALLGGVAAVGGAAYFAFSAIVALYTAYGQQINDAILKTTDLEKAQRELGTSTIEAAKSTDTARAEILKITSIVQAAKDGFIDKSAAIQLYNEKLGDSFGKVTTLAEAEQALIDKSPKYVEALMLKAKAEFYFAKASEFAIKKDIAGLEDQTSALDKLVITAKTVAAFADVAGVKGILKTLVEGIGQAQAEGVAEVTKTAGAIADVLTTEGKKTMAAYFKALKESGLNDSDIQAIIDKLNKTLLKSTEKTDAEKLKAIKDADDAQTKSHLDTLDERAKKEYQALLDLEDRLAKMNAAGYKDATLHFAAYRQKILDISKYYDDKEAKEQERINKEKAAADKVIADRNLQNSLDALKIESDVAIKIANASGKSTAADRIAILENYKKKLNELAGVGGYTADQLDKIKDAIIRNDGAIEGSIDKLSNFKISWTDTLNTINKGILDFVENSINFLAESLGKALAGQEIDVFQGLALILADSLMGLGKALIAYAVPVLLALTLLKKPSIPTAIAAIAAGVTAVAAGAFLKAKLNKKNESGGATAFANGGIISGPTMGLMGEYPGARTNPEVVAPLDKLKDMIGGNGGGSFVLRGTDLVLALNRSETSLNLRRGS
jgi:hypothetical protein